MLTIDGSQGEGGGQILRTSLALSLITQTPMRMIRIREGRNVPGLRLQHLAAIRAAARIGNANVQFGKGLHGSELGARELTFTPGRVQFGNYTFAVETAGSIMLVLQTILPPLMLAAAPSKLMLEGGTHNPHAPPFDFIQCAFLPLINRMGPTITATLERPGFYPEGGGRCVVDIRPVSRLAALNVIERGTITRKRARAMLAQLPMHIAEGELNVIAKALKWSPEHLEVDQCTTALGCGNVAIIEIAAEHVTEVFTGFGQLHKRAEIVAREAADEAREYLEAGVPIGPHLADQLLLPLALAGGGSFVTMPLTRHSRTNIDIIQKFLDVRVTAELIADHTWQVAIR